MSDWQKTSKFYMYCEICGASSTHVHINQWSGLCQDCAREVYESEKGSY